ncbi:MAG: hypothetical protein COB30_011425 [Ectothiorhodospiraceae bacterium]|nr:hypothetical protein [Ectothiorhodospiraceae bacterium]
MSHRKKPDIFTVLIVVVTLGFIASSVAQGVNLNPSEEHVTQVMSANPALQSLASSRQ